jgi:hypothetical protein
MSEENMEELKEQVNAELGKESEEITNEEEHQFTDDEVKAMEKGWRPKEEFDGDPDDWRTAKQFNEFGEMKRSIKESQARIDGMKRSHNEEIANLNILHRKQLSDREQELKSQLETAVDDGDTKKAAEIMEEQKSIVAQQATLSQNAPKQESQQEAATKQLEWENKNDWVFEDTPKARKAQAAFALAQNRGMSMDATLEFVEERVAGIPDANAQLNVNKNRLKPGNTTASGQRSGGKGKAKLTVGDCTSDELKYRELYPEGEAGDKAFLKTIENNRKEA